MRRARNVGQPLGFTMKIIRLVCTLFSLALGVSVCATVTSTVNRTGPVIVNPLPATVPVGFPFQSSSELQVLDLGQNGTGNDPAVVLTLNSDYTVTGGGYNSQQQMQSGNVIVVGTGAHAVKANDQIVILRNVPVTQATSFVSGVPSWKTVETALDKVATVDQMQTEVLGRALRFEPGETIDGTLNRTQRAGKYLGFDSTGAIAYLTGGSGGGGSTYYAGAGLTLNSNVFAVDPTQSLTSLTVTNPIAGNLAGNADTATALQTPRAINGVAFDGTAAITVPAAAATLTGTTLANNVTDSSLTKVAAGTIGSMAVQNSNTVAITGGSITGASVTGLPSPTNPSDAATKGYADAIAAGIVLRTAVVAATTANITLSGPQTIDGVAVIAGNRVLVKNQSTTSQNGIYDVAAGAWTRSSDSNTAGQLKIGYTYFVQSGTINASSTWSITTQPTVLGSDPVVFSQFSASQQYTAGNGLSLTGNQFGITAPVSAANGGTGNTSYTTGDLLYASSSSVLSRLPAVANGSVLVSQGVASAPAYSSTPTVTNLTTTGSTIVSDGSVGAGTGALYFASDTDTGLYRAGVNTLGFFANGASIGTWSPSFLSVATGLSVGPGGTGTNNGLLYLEGSNASSYGAAIRFKRNGANTWQVGNSSAVLGGTSNDLVFYSGDASATIATLSPTGVAVTGSTGISVAGVSSGAFLNNTTTGYTNAYIGVRIGNSAGTDGSYFGMAGTGTPGLGLSSNDTFVYCPSAFGVSINGTKYLSLSTTGLVLSGSLSVLSSSVGATDFSITNNSVGGHQFIWSALGSGTGTPGYLQLADNTASKTLVSIGTDQKWAFGGNITAPAAGINGVINVKIYGAKGDGVTNDTSAIASAVSALSASGSALYFPPGTYITDTITITGKTGLAISGEGIGVSTIKNRTGGQVLNISSSSNVTVRGLTFNGNCGARSAGQHAVVFEASQSSFCDNEIINSGEFSFLAGSGASTITDLTVSRVLIRNGYADGINLQNVQRFVIADPIIDGADDDLVALGYNGSGVCAYGSVIGGTLKARTGLGTSWGRGIWVGQGAHDITVTGTNIIGAKQTGVYLNGSAASPCVRISVKDVKVSGCATSSGHGVAAYSTQYCTLEGLTVENNSSGNCIDIADWNYLVIKGGVLRQENNVFARGIHADEGAWTNTTWTGLSISNVTIDMIGGASTNSCVYLVPHSSITMSRGSVVAVTGTMVNAGDYITISAARQAGTWKVGNNVTLTGNSVTSGGTLFNNN